MQTLDEMRSARFLSDTQHADISAWIIQCSTPDEIMQMPAHLWRALQLASMLMNVDADLLPMQGP